LYWALLIDNRKDLERFIKDKAADLTSAYQEAKGLVEVRGDATHGSIMAYVLSCELMKHEGRKSFVDDVLIYCNKFLSPYTRVFESEGAIVIWQNTNKWIPGSKYGGFMPYSGFKNHPAGLKIVKTIKKYELEFPKDEELKEYTEDDITINKWTEGSHYYAKIGDIDVVDEDGHVKWNSGDIAREKAIEYLKTL
jgi:hypothetical protein